MSTGNVRFRIVDVINLSSSADALLRDRVLAMRANGYDNRIVCMDGAHVAGLRRQGIPVHTVSLPRGLDPLRLLQALVQLTRYLVRERIDLVHTHCSVPGAVGRLAAWFARVPVVIHTAHGFYFHEARSPLKRRLGIGAEWLSGRLTHVLLTQNREELALVERHGIGPAGHRRWIGNGIDVDRFAVTRQPEARGRHPVTIVCAARLEPVKQHETLLEAAALMRRRGDVFRMRFVGDGPLRERLEARAAELGLGGFVEFLGWRSDMAQVLAESDIGALVSVREGIPRAVLEAMAAGLPVVATDVSGTRETVRHGETGLLVPLGDPVALANALRSLANDAGRRAEMGARGRARVAEEFDERRIIDALDRVYQGELAGRTPRAAGAPVPDAAAPEQGSDVAPARAPEAEAGAVTVGRNFSFRLGSQLASALINVAGLALLGRGLSAAGYGEYAFYYALIPLLSAAGDAGVGIVATREIARHPAAARTLLGDAILLKILLAGPLLALVLLVSGATMDRAHLLPLAIVVTAAFLDFGQDPSIWLLRARERLDLEGMLLLVSQLVWLALLAVGVATQAGLLALLAAAPVAYAVRAVAGASIAARRVQGPRFQPDRARWIAHVAQGLPFGVAMFTAVLYGRVGVLMLKAFAGATDLACFNVAYLLSQPLGFVASALGLALFPALARQAGGDLDGVRTALRHTLRAQMLVAFPLAVALAFLADIVVEILFHGRGFTPAAGVLRVMSLGLPLIFFNLVARYTLAALDRQANYLGAMAWGLAANIGAGMLLVPRFGAIGACASLLAAEAVIAALCVRALRGRVRLREIVRDAARPFAAALGMAAVFAVLRGAGPWLAAPAGVLAYLALSLRTGALRTADLELGRRVVSTFRPRRAGEAPSAVLVPHREGGRT